VGRDGDIVPPVDADGVDGRRRPPVVPVRVQAHVAEPPAVGADSVQEVHSAVIGGDATGRASGEGDLPDVPVVRRREHGPVGGEDVVVVDVRQPFRRDLLGRCGTVDGQEPEFPVAVDQQSVAGRRVRCLVEPVA
jgi:hypothetical protein